jgi:hypothetical protein
VTDKSRLHAPRIAGVVLIVLAVLSTVSGVIVTIREHNRIQCQANVNGAFSHALIERSDASDTERHALRDMIGVILDPKATPQAKKDALTAYYDGLQKADTTRAANPLPDASTCR